MEELVYTSAPQGLRQGSSGFCTVEMTDGMPPEMMDSLESLSAYDNDPSKTVNWMHVRFHSARGVRHVLSRVGPLRGEFSGRTNKLAHHICLAQAELPSAGPMRIVGPSGPLRRQWSGQIQRLKPQAAPTNLRDVSVPRVCRNWASAVGDAGAAGALLARLRQTGSSPLWVIRTPQIDALAMIDEMLALIPGQQRWDVTFCTYLHTLPRSAECRLRWVLTDSPAMQQLRNIGPDQLIDLRDGAEAVLRGADDAWVDAARRGTAIADTSSSAGAARSSLGTSGGTQRQRAISQVDLRHAEFASTDQTEHDLPPPPPAQQSSPLRWVMVGAAVAIIPACVLMFFLISRDPEPVVAIREPGIQAQSNPQIDDPPQAAPAPQSTQPKSNAPPKIDKQPTRRPTKTKSRIDREKKDPGPKVPQPPKPRSQIPQTIPIRLKLPGIRMDERQSIHQPSGIYEVSLSPVVPVFHALQFRLTPPDPSGVRDLEYVTESSEPHRIGTIYTEPDQVLFAWSPGAERSDAADFLLTHELLIKDDTHRTTIQFELAKLVQLKSLPTPVRSFDIDMPDWFDPKCECLLKARFPAQNIEISMIVLPRPQSLDELKWKSKRVDIASLGDPFIHEAIISTRAYTISSVRGWKIVFASGLDFRSNGQVFSLAQLDRVIHEQARRFNRAAEDRIMSSDRRRDLFDTCRKSLGCELSLYARVNGRDILWGKSGGEAE